MNYTFDEVICDCGSKTFLQNPCSQAEDGHWTTKAERDANPDMKTASIQQLVYIGDDTWFVCSKCGKDVDTQKCLDLIKTIDWPKVKWTEEVGVAIINQRGLKKLDINKKDDNEGS